jgi:hypothetical protein
MRQTEELTVEQWRLLEILIGDMPRWVGLAPGFHEFQNALSGQ